MRAILCALAFAAMAPVAWAQSAPAGGSYNIGSYTVGAVHQITLTAHNENCRQPLDFRFDFPRSSWLRPVGATEVRGVPEGESRPLPAIVDLSQMTPGHYATRIDVSCANCGLLIFRNCHFDKRHLTVEVDAIAPPVVPPRPTRVPHPNAPAQTTASATTVTPPQTTTAPTPATVTTIAPLAPPPVAAVCDPNANTWKWAAFGALGAFLLTAAAALRGLGRNAGGGGGGERGVNAARNALTAKAREFMDGGSRSGGSSSALAQLTQDFVDRQIDEAGKRCDRLREEMTTLMHAQLQAMRALTGLSLADHRHAPLAGEVGQWTKFVNGAGYGVTEKQAIEPRGSRTMPDSLQTGLGGLQNHQGLFTSSGDEATRLTWLMQQGFARSDEAARAALTEMSSYSAHRGMRDMNVRLQRAIQEWRRADAALAIMKAAKLATC